jgi:hypothetical protein
MSHHMAAILICGVIKIVNLPLGLFAFYEQYYFI